MEMSFTEDQENIRPSAAATIFSPRGRMPFSDNVGFGYDDCGHDDSFMRFVDSPRAGLTLPVPLSFDDDEEEDDEEDNEGSGMDWQPLGVVAFRPSPSEPGPRTKSGGQKPASELLPRKPSAPPPSTSSGSRRQSCKRPSPSAARTNRDNARTPSNNAEDCYNTTDDEDSDCRRDSVPSKAHDEGKSAGAGGTPKRRRLVRPLGDLTNSTTPTFGFKKPSLIQHQQQQRLAALHRCSSEVTCGASAEAPVRPTLHRQESVSTALDSARVDRAIASIDSLNLIGNSEQQHALPTVKELDYGIRHVTSATVSRLVNGEFADSVSSYAIIDCRYPYEFSGGHIRGAVNIYNQEDLLRRFLEPVRSVDPAGRPAATVLIFHCEFSSERAPKMARLLRQCDREANASNYPDLYYPEVYVLQGGYKAFYEHFKCNCQPANYVKMVDPVYKAELAQFQRVGRAWERQHSRSKHSRLERLAAGDVLF